MVIPATLNTERLMHVLLVRHLARKRKSFYEKGYVSEMLSTASLIEIISKL